MAFRRTKDRGHAYGPVSADDDSALSAAREGNLSIVEGALDRGMNINAQNEHVTPFVKQKHK